MRTGHLPALDGIRGVAALTVVIAHCAAFYWLEIGRPASLAGFGLQKLAHTGQLAVILFFVLSGFVLQLALERRPDTPYVPYLVRRAFRLYPALLASLALSLLLRLALSPAIDPALSDRVNANLTSPTDPITVLRHILLLASGPGDTRLNPVIWSLALELRFSLLLIPLGLLARRWPVAVLLVAATAYVAAAALIRIFGYATPLQSGETNLEALTSTLYYLPGFCFGILAARAAVAGKVRSGRRALTGAAGLAAFAMLTDDKTLWAAAFALFIFAAARPGMFAQALAWPAVRFLGDISYSLYLVHFPILLTSLYAFHATLGPAGAIAVAVIVSVTLSAALFRWVERPGIALCARLSARVATGRRRRVVAS